MAAHYKAPGRLGDPNLTVQDDPRAIPALVETLKIFQMGGHNTSPYVTEFSELEPIMRANEEGFVALFGNLSTDLPSDKDEPSVDEKTITIDGVDGNKIDLFVFSPPKAADKGPLPAVVYVHGGGMTILPTRNACTDRWCKSIALNGVVVISVDFRNAWTPTKHNPFPAGLNDCAAAVKYLSAHKSQLGIGKIVLQGESGGANLVLATALKANREGWIDAIGGVYACAPYVSGAYGQSDEWKAQNLPSLLENDGYLLTVPGMAGMAKYYSPGQGEMTNPLAWPYHATEKDLKGLPPHVINPDELDPLRDEGILYFRKLVAAGVPATAEVNLGTIHTAAMMFRQALPQAHAKVARQIAAFAKSL